MKIIKDYETIINISASEMYGDINKVLMEKLITRFENKCEKNSLITKILEIIKRSSCHLAKSRLDGSGDINVQFRAEAIVYYEDEILTGCEVQKIERKSKIICKHKSAVINIKGNRNLQSLNVGQMLTIKITSVSYLKGKDKITIHGVPYSYSYSFIVYQPNNNIIPNESIIMIKNKIQKINDELTLHEKSNKTLLTFFDNMFYPFTKKFDKKGNNYIDIIDLANQLINGNKPDLQNKYLSRHPIINKSTPFVLELNDTNNSLMDPNIYDVNICVESLDFIIIKILNDYYTHLKVIRELSEIFMDDQLFNSHTNIWNIYEKLKQ